MRKVLFFMSLLVVTSFTAQTTIFSENFNSVPEGQVPAGWMTTRNPNSEFNPWATNSVNNNSLQRSCSVVLNWYYDYANLGTPQIDLAAGYYYSLSFLLRHDNGTNGSPIFSIYVLPATATFTGTETPVFQEQLYPVNDVTKTIDLSPFAGQNVKIYFRVKALVSIFSFTSIDDFKITQQTSLGTSESTIKADAGIYPNPSSDFINLKTDSTVTKAEVFDQAGRKMNVQLTHDKVDVRSLPAGAYIIAVETKNKKYSQKFIKK
ncbi:hypothetical protein C1631_006880 [Chryseobacterium phosphatilyticum]|uniref:Secretion system C-terminal sorting domain-containing protein n=1 Tax=Chryseobacterium phosphatilyticum TaxID=475075 RepID=A0A316XHQ0_9FLAO|nr:T9SS type A sorting domain-containing protein [Chryseobacterium phosphatilyticum]PWN72316.1 hypothetical protein C1631_006880 [Chryseobacterium phosphatilyticum]